MTEMMFFILSFGFLLAYVIGILAVIKEVESSTNKDEEYRDDFALEQLQEVHQSNTYNVKDMYIPKGQQLTPEMFK
jgi:hypothetical protein